MQKQPQGKQPQDRDQQDPERTWRNHRLIGRFPAQPAHRGHRTRPDALSWCELNSLPTGAVRHHLKPR
ncbi:DNA repair protein [Micromonospora sp. HNM0581]|nr:DNA repair protein [Micromonospora sp. HNM0581]